MECTIVIGVFFDSILGQSEFDCNQYCLIIVCLPFEWFYFMGHAYFAHYCGSGWSRIYNWNNSKFNLYSNYAANKLQMLKQLIIPEDGTKPDNHELLWYSAFNVLLHAHRWWIQLIQLKNYKINFISTASLISAQNSWNIWCTNTKKIHEQESKLVLLIQFSRQCVPKWFRHA